MILKGLVIDTFQYVKEEAIIFATIREKPENKRARVSGGTRSLAPLCAQNMHVNYVAADISGG